MTDNLFILLMDIAPEDEVLFNEMYDNDHLTHMMAVSGNLQCDRFVLEWNTGSELQRYLVIYQIDDPELPRSPAWQAQAAKGEWAGIMRDRIRNRANGVFRRINGGGASLADGWPGPGVVLQPGEGDVRRLGCTAWELLWSSAGEMPRTITLCSSGFPPTQTDQSGQVGCYRQIARHMHRPLD